MPIIHHAKGVTKSYLSAEIILDDEGRAETVGINFNYIVMKILRRFRYYFLEENKFRKYGLYAIGEVILIVIGILIALQLNNLNENKIDRERERVYLEEFLNDLSICKTDLQRTVKRTSEDYTHTDSLLNVIQNRRLDLDPIDAGRLLMDPYGWSTFEGSDGTVTEILNGGNLHLIRNPEIRSSIASWHANLKDMQSWEVVLREFVEDYYSFTMDYLDVERSDLTDSSISKLHGDSQFINYTKTITKSKLIQLSDNLRFKNLVADIRWRQKHLNGIYLKKEKEMDSLIEIISLELQEFN